MKDLGTKVIGTWDDHDYGVNDGDINYINKHLMRDIFLDFVDEPEDSERRLDLQSPIHQDYLVEIGDFKTHIVLLDNRWDFDKEKGDRLG